MTKRVSYYNENDPKAAAWLRELIARNLIAPGIVDDRSIADVRAGDLAGFAQCHFFAGIGGWSYALRLSGWPDDQPVWTGSCPCQTHSTAAHGRNVEQDWWPEWHKLIVSAAPRVVFGEQVANARRWIDTVADDMEGVGYTFGAAILPAVSAGFDHTRNRIYFVGHSDVRRQSSSEVNAEASVLSRNRSVTGSVLSPHGVPRRMAIRGFGNAIVPQVAAAFIEAYREVSKGVA